MDKIVQAVNAMIANVDSIGDVQRGDEHHAELFFSYLGKYIWSMMGEPSGDFKLWFYPGQESIEYVRHLGAPDFENIAVVFYNTKEIGTKEAKASFAELYSILSQKVHGMDKVLDDIISSTPLPK
jgi:hypothetical protein